MFGRLQRLAWPVVRERSARLLEVFDLGGAGKKAVKTYSGGMRRKLDLALSLMAEPPILFLDEPTAGLDPASRHALWDIIRELVRRGTTVLTPAGLSPPERQPNSRPGSARRSST